MARTNVSIIAVVLTSALLASLALAPSPFAVAVAAEGWISPRQAVPDDPLAGLPDENGGDRHPGKKQSNRTCALNAAPANAREIGDLRATLAFVKNGPAAWLCPARSGQPDIRLRISIDGAGKITAADAVAGDPAIASAIAKKLSGKAVGPRAEGPTVGIVVLKLATGRS